MRSWILCQDQESGDESGRVSSQVGPWAKGEESLPYVHMAEFQGSSLYKALRKKQLVAEGKLGKFGKILETTPAEIKHEFER